jgi:type II secretory pathway pseudopilin PulG
MYKLVNFSVFNASGKHKLEHGQALLIVVLVMVIALTVGLSVAIRSITNIRTSSEDENSERAFTAAEAGIEQAFLTNSSVPLTSLSNNSSFQTTVATLAGSDFIANNGTKILKNEPVDVWLSNYPDYSSPWSGNLTINWGQSADLCNPNEANNTQAALEVVLITGTAANPQASSFLLDPCSPRTATNNFEYVTTPGNTINGKLFFRSKTINVSSGIIARIIPLYASSDVGIQKGAADPAFPSQGTIVTSTGISDSTQRKIISFRSHPKLPAELFPYVFFSPK